MSFRKIITAYGLVGVALLVGTLWFHPKGEAAQVFPDLVGWWRFADGSGTIATDSSGQGNDGGLVGSAYFTTDPVVGNALNVPNASGGVVVPHSPSLEPPTGTLEAWVRPDSPQDSDILVKTTDLMVRTNRSGSFAVYGLRIKRDGAVQGFVLNDDPVTLVPWTFVYSRRGLVKPGEWHHLAVRWDGTAVAVFVDGKLQAAVPYDPVPDTGLSYHGTSTFSMAGGTVWDPRPHEHEFTGLLADVRFYARARTESEIFSDYAALGALTSRQSARR